MASFPSSKYSSAQGNPPTKIYPPLLILLVCASSVRRCAADVVPLALLIVEHVAGVSGFIGVVRCEGYYIVGVGP